MKTIITSVLGLVLFSMSVMAQNNATNVTKTQSTPAPAAVSAPAQNNTLITKEVKAEAQTAEDVKTDKNYTSFNSDYIEAGITAAFQTDTGIGGYALWNGIIIDRMDNGFAMDMKFGGSYLSMHHQILNVNGAVIPSYKISKGGIDYTFFGAVELGYGSIWDDPTKGNDVSDIAYGLSTGVEISVWGMYLKPFYRWTNYDRFEGYSTITNHGVGLEWSYVIPEMSVPVAIVVGYEHVFSTNEKMFDNEDRITFGLRYHF
jgi:hypothetical protein